MPGQNLKSFAAAKVRYITGHTITISSRIVRMKVKWHNSDVETEEFKTATLSESDVHEVAEDLLLEYWKDAGGRRETTGLERDRVFKILDESKRHWVVQWVGCSVEDATYDPKYEITLIPGAGEAIVKWRRSLPQEQLMEVDCWRLGEGGSNGFPAWMSLLPEVDWESVDLPDM
ncbi:hypothetical protein FLONG3_9765 [Fusarium longipes]|uniref:Uncharacterized protein n=1 Tax=Fusarium longipes TaxID=694270 RepID=A0A395RUT7_9HYPO|nr:hypothetical protein FLONG3_9765 [Fusarium longipes]